MAEQAATSPCYEIVVKEELIIEDELDVHDEGQHSIVHEELIIKDELDLPEEQEEETVEDLTSAESKVPLFACNICHEAFEHTYELARHIKAHKYESNQQKEFHCEFCGKVFEMRTIYNKHLRRHRPHTFKCHLCPKTFPENCNLTRHLKLNHNIQTPTVKVERVNQDEIDPTRYCEQCNQTFKTRQNCDNHKRKHKSVEEGRFKCAPCGKSFSNHFALVLHKKSAPHKKMVEPKKDVEFHCTVCDKVFQAKVQFTKHLKRHRPPNFHCSHCPKSFPVNCDLTRHLRLVHKVSNPALGGSNDAREDEPTSQSETLTKEEPADGSSSLDEGEDLLSEMTQPCEECN
uniref:Zinc finger protein 37 homolog n=1 Tax=Culex pipiens TaxID=7175 RepID=A0A8D8JLH2_CULPI